MTGADCPAEDRLVEPDAAVLAHLAGCPECRDRRAGMAADDRFLGRVRQVLAGDGPGDGSGGFEGLVPGYRLGGVIARGGQGLVREAVDVASGEAVAIKLVGEAGRISTRERLRFEREARLAARLDHPGVARVLASGVARDGRPYLVMERVHGVRLDAHPIFHAGRGGAADRRRAVELLRSTVDAVASAHGRGVIHRDLKPSNVLVEADGTPRVIDFGLARATLGSIAAESATGPGPADEPAHDPTVTGEFVGSLAYAAPEQLAGEQDVDARADVYALGVMGYEMLVGAPPYASATTAAGAHAAIRDRIEREPRRPRAIEPRLDGDLDAILHAAVRNDPGRRYPSAEAFSRDLRLYLEGEQVDVRRDSRWYVLRRTARRHRIGLSITALVVVVSTAASIVATRGWQRAIGAEQLAATRATQLEAALLASDLERAQLALAAGDIPLAESLAWRVRLTAERGASPAGGDGTSLLRRANGTLRELYSQAPSLAAVAAPPGWALGRPRWEGEAGDAVRLLIDDTTDAAWAPTGGGLEFEAPPAGSRWLPLRGSPDRRARVDELGRIHLPEVGPLGTPRTSVDPEAEDDRIVQLWSDADLRWLVVGHASGLATLHSVAESGGPVRRFEAGAGRVAISPDGRWVLGGQPDGSLEVWSTRDRSRVGTIGSDRSGAACFSPDGTRLAVVEGADVHLHRLPDLALERVLEGGHRWVVDLAFDSDGARLVAAGWDRRVLVWRVADGRRVADWRGHTETILGVRFSPDGRRIASVDRGGTIRLWQSAGDAGPTSDATVDGAVRRWNFGRGAVMELVVLPDRRRLVAGFEDGGVVVFDAASRTIEATWTAADAVIGAVTALPGGEGVVVVAYDGTVARFDLDGTRRWSARLAGPLSDVAADPSGAVVAVAGVDGAVHRFGIPDGRAFGAEPRHDGRVVSLAFSPDGTELASAGRDGTVVTGPAAGAPAGASEAASPRIIGRVESGVARVVAYDPTGRWLAFAGDDRKHHLVDRRPGGVTSSLRHGGESIFGLAFDPLGERLASIDAAGRLTMLEGPPWTVVRSLPAHPTMGFAVVFAADAATVITAGGDGTVAWRRLDTAAACIKGMRRYWIAIEDARTGG